MATDKRVRKNPSSLREGTGVRTGNGTKWAEKCNLLHRTHTLFTDLCLLIDIYVVGQLRSSGAGFGCVYLLSDEMKIGEERERERCGTCFIFIRSLQ